MKKLTKTQKKKNAAIYKKIKKEYNKITEKFEAVGKKNPISYRGFKNRVLSRKEAYDLSLKEAIKKEANTETFVNPGERAKTNFINMLKDKHADSWNELKLKSRDKFGRFKKMDIKWNKEDKRYELNGEYYIDINNSPEEVIIGEIK